MLTWKQFREVRPEMADAGRQLFYQFGVGLAFLGTVRRDGGPRLHPMCPVFFEDNLYAFIEPGPKRNDLHRDSRYALHCFPPANNEDAIYVTGRAEYREDDADLREQVAAIFWSERKMVASPPQHTRNELFEFLVDNALLTKTTGHGDWNPQHTIWRGALTS